MTMTKIQKHFNLEYTSDGEALLQKINRAQAIYGIERIKLAPALDSVMVEFDASRLRISDIEATLRGCGLPVTVPAPPELVVKVETPAAPNQA